MAVAVLCGPARHVPDLLAGHFETADDADDWIADQTAQPGRYMVVMALTAPKTVDHSGARRADPLPRSRSAVVNAMMLAARSARIADFRAAMAD
jgi:hypothetical protein